MVSLLLNLMLGAWCWCSQQETSSWPVSLLMDREHWPVAVCTLRLDSDGMQMLQRSPQRARVSEPSARARCRRSDCIKQAEGGAHQSQESSHNQSSSSLISHALTRCCVGGQQSDTLRSHPAIVVSHWQGCQSQQSPGASQQGLDLRSRGFYSQYSSLNSCSFPIMQFFH